MGPVCVENANGDGTATSSLTPHRDDEVIDVGPALPCDSPPRSSPPATRWRARHRDGCSGARTLRTSAKSALISDGESSHVNRISQPEDRSALPNAARIARAQGWCRR